MRGGAKAVAAAPPWSEKFAIHARVDRGWLDEALLFACLLTAALTVSLGTHSERIVINHECGVIAVERCTVMSSVRNAAERAVGGAVGGAASNSHVALLAHDTGIRGNLLFEAGETILVTDKGDGECTMPLWLDLENRESGNF